MITNPSKSLASNIGKELRTTTAKNASHVTDHFAKEDVPRRPPALVSGCAVYFMYFVDRASGRSPRFCGQLEALSAHPDNDFTPGGLFSPLDVRPLYQLQIILIPKRGNCYCTNGKSSQGTGSIKWRRTKVDEPSFVLCQLMGVVGILLSSWLTI